MFLNDGSISCDGDTLTAGTPYVDQDYVLGSGPVNFSETTPANTVTQLVANCPITWTLNSGSYDSNIVTGFDTDGLITVDVSLPAYLGTTYTLTVLATSVLSL